MSTDAIAPLVPGAMRARVEGGEVIFTLRTPTVQQVVARIEQALNARVQVEDLSLEDIFLEMHHG
jgi:hypothetical protein